MRVERIELSTKRWQRLILPLNYTRIFGTTGRTRTGTHKAGDFKSPAATYYATVALFGGVSRDRTYLPEATGLQPARTPLFHSLRINILLYQNLPLWANQKFGIPSGTRTPTNSFGDWYAAITLRR